LEQFLSLQNNIEKLIFRENEIENLLVNSSKLNSNDLAELSKELSEIKLITDLAKKKDELVKELLDLSEILNDKYADNEIKEIANTEFVFLKEKDIISAEEKAKTLRKRQGLVPDFLIHAPFDGPERPLLMELKTLHYSTGTYPTRDARCHAVLRRANALPAEYANKARRVDQR